VNGTPALPGKLSADSCVLALVKLRKRSAAGTVFLDLLLVFQYSSPCALPGELEHKLVLDVYTFLLPKIFFAVVSGTAHAVAAQLWTGWWRWHLLSSADQSMTVRTAFFQCQQPAVLCCLVLLLVT